MDVFDVSEDIREVNKFLLRESKPNKKQSMLQFAPLIREAFFKRDRAYVITDRSRLVLFARPGGVLAVNINFVGEDTQYKAPNHKSIYLFLQFMEEQGISIKGVR